MINCRFTLNVYQYYKGYIIAIDKALGNWHVYTSAEKHLASFREYISAIDYINNQDFYLV